MEVAISMVEDNERQKINIIAFP